MPAPRPLVLVLVLAALVAACAQAPAAAAPSATPTAAAPTPSLTDGAATPDSASASVAPAGTRPGTAASPVLGPEPAGARLATAGGSTAGRLGSWTLPGRGTDAPWQPAATMTEVKVTAGARLTVTLADGSSISAWQAVFAAASDAGGNTVTGLGGREAETPALTSITLDPVPTGSWVVMVHVRFPGGGSAAYYWFITAA